MAIEVNLRDIQTGFLSASAIDMNNTLIEQAFVKALNREGGDNNAMEADLDLGLNNILNVDNLSVNKIDIDGTNYETVLQSIADAAQQSENLAESWANADEDVVVKDGRYSAKHFAIKAETAYDSMEPQFQEDRIRREAEFQASQDAREGVFNAYLVSAGYQFAGDYAAGIEITQYNQVVRDTSGEFWRLSGSTGLPYTTTGAGLPEGGAFVNAGDAVLRQDLSQSGQGKGAGLIGGLPFVTPQMFGAKADGVTDDSGALQAAIDAAALQGKTCYIPRLNSPYFVSNTTQLPSGTTIESNGATILALLRTVPTTEGTGNTSLLVFENSDVINGNSDISIRGLIIDGGAPADSYASGVASSLADTSNLISLENTDNIIFDGVTIVNFVSCVYMPAMQFEESKMHHAAARFYSCNNVSFVNCKQLNSEFEGIWFHRSTNVFIDNFYSKNKRTSTPLHLWYCEGVKLLNSVIDESETNRQGSSVNLCSRDVIVDNVTLNNSAGLDLGNEIGTTFAMRNVIVTNCSFIDCKLYMAGTDNLDFEDLVIASNTFIAQTKPIYGLIDIGCLKKVIIQGNTLKSENDITVALQLRQLSENLVDVVEGVVIHDNYFHNFDFGILLVTDGGKGLDGVEITDNYFSECSGVRIKNEGGGFVKNVSFTGNTIKKTSADSGNEYEGYNCGFSYIYSDVTMNVNGSEILENLLIENNSIYDFSAWVFIYVPVSLDNDPIVRGISVRNNNFDAPASGASQGLRVNRGQNVIVAGNTMANAAANFIRVDSPQGAIRIADNVCLNKDINAPYIFRSGAGSFSHPFILKDNYSDNSSANYSITSAVTYSPSFAQVEGNWPDTYSGVNFSSTAAGATARRPSVSTVPVGHRYFDTSLGKPIYSTGAAWVDSDGVAV